MGTGCRQWVVSPHNTLGQHPASAALSPFAARLPDFEIVGDFSEIARAAQQAE